MQTWERRDGLSHLLPRSIDVKQEKLPAPFLRFQLRATPAPATAPVATPPTPSAVENQP